MTTSDTTPAPTPEMTGGPVPYTPTPTPTFSGGPAPYTPAPCPTDEPTTPAPTPTPTPTYTPPVLHCGPWEVPGWLDSHGNPTSCTNNCPWVGQTAAECHAPATETPTPTPSPTTRDNAGNTMAGGPELLATPTPTSSAVLVSSTAPSTPQLAETGMDVTTGILLGVAALTAVVAGVWMRARASRIARKAAE